MADAGELHRIASRDGTVLGYARSGSGPPLVLVHGTTADHRRWAPALARLEPHFTVCALDRRGRGASGDAPAYELAREAEDVAALVESLGEPACVLAHSYGAVCALEGARLTDKVRRLALYEPPIPTGVAMYPPGLPERLEALLAGGDREGALEAFFREVVRMPDDELAGFRRSPMWPIRVPLAPTIPRELAIDRGYRFDAAQFANFRVPTLLMLGGDSPPLFKRAIETLHAGLPGSEIAILPGQQHIAIDTAPELFAGEALKFLLG